MKRKKRRLLICIIIAELVACAASLHVIKYLYDKIDAEERRAAALDTLGGFNDSIIITSGKKAVRVGLEQVREECSETVWTTADAVYRTGPGTGYESAGSLYQAASLTRTGVTYNEWSRVSIGGEDYYISSELLTTEAPLITDGGVKGDYERYALSRFANYGWADEEIRPLIYLWNRESGWNPRSHNKRSGAHGIPQAIPASKMASEGSDYYTNGYTQIRWGLNYIYNRYGSPSGAWGHFQRTGWY